jgi:hypothetical protein
MTEDLGSGTAKGLIHYLNSLVDKGRSRAGVVTPLKTALVKVLEKTEGDEWEKVDVTKLDVADAIARFKNLTLGVYTDASYRAYELRVMRAIKWYKKFLENPGWFPKESASRNIKPENSNGKKKETVDTKAQKAHTVPRQTPEQSGHQPSRGELPKIDAIAYPFPLSNGETARVYMPNGVTKSDIKRLSLFLEALVIDKEG